MWGRSGGYMETAQTFSTIKSRTNQRLTPKRHLGLCSNVGVLLRLLCLVRRRVRLHAGGRLANHPEHQNQCNWHASQEQAHDEQWAGPKEAVQPDTGNEGCQDDENGKAAYL